ncbi:MAG: hypothetical protein GY835_23735 [bacterium]|nr:hypothetical protein [bacterium]
METVSLSFRIEKELADGVESFREIFHDKLAAKHGVAVSKTDAIARLLTIGLKHADEAWADL